MGLSLPKAHLISLCVSTFLYGVFFALVLITTALFTHKPTDDIRRQRLKTLPMSFAMLAVATMYFIVGWIRAVDGFIEHKSALAFYADVSNPTYLIRSTGLCLQSVLGDGILIWRLYIVYGRRIRVIIPALIVVIAYTVLGIIILVISKSLHPGTGRDLFKVAKIWVTAYFSLTMITNLLLSGAIALKIFLAGNPLQASRPHWLIIFTLVESCALYTLTVVVALATFLSGSYVQYTAVDAIPMMVGISFSLLVLQIRFHVSASNGPRSNSLGAAWPQSGGFHVSGPRSRASDAVWSQPGSRPAGGEEPTYIRMAVHSNVPHVVRKDSDAYESTLDMDKSVAV